MGVHHCGASAFRVTGIQIVGLRSIPDKDSDDAVVIAQVQILAGFDCPSAHERLAHLTLLQIKTSQRDCFDNKAAQV